MNFMKYFIPKPKKIGLLYKVVQVSPDGRMWSANPNPYHFNATDDLTLVEYKLHHIVYPNTQTPALFCFDSLSKAKACMHLYGRGVSSIGACVLRGYGFNTRPLKSSNVKSDTSFLDIAPFFVPEDIWENTILCSKFIPIQVSVKLTKTRK